MRLAPAETAGALTFALDLPVDDAGNVAVVTTRLDLAAGRVVWTASSPNPSCCAFPVLVATPDGSTVLVGSDAIYLLDGEGRVVRREAALAEGEAALGAALSADGRRAVVTTSEGRVLGLERERAGLAWALHTRQPEVATAVSRDGRVIAIATPDDVRLAAWAAGEPRTLERRTLPFRPSWISVGIDATGERYAVVSMPPGAEARLYFYAQGQPAALAEATIPGARLPEVTVTSNGALAVVTSTWVAGAGAIVPPGGARWWCRSIPTAGWSAWQPAWRATAWQCYRAGAWTCGAGQKGTPSGHSASTCRARRSPLPATGSWSLARRRGTAC